MGLARRCATIIGNGERRGYRWTPHSTVISVCCFTDDFASGTHACAAVPPVVRRSQTYEVNVFDQIPTLEEVAKNTHCASPAVSDRDGANWRSTLQDMVVEAPSGRLHPAAEAMLELGSDKHENKNEKARWSLSRSFRNLRVSCCSCCGGNKGGKSFTSHTDVAPYRTKQVRQARRRGQRARVPAVRARPLCALLAPHDLDGRGPTTTMTPVQRVLPPTEPKAPPMAKPPMSASRNRAEA
jgi:hypothetical protein